MHTLAVRLIGLIFIFMSLVAGAANEACPNYLRNLPTRHLGSYSLCAIYIKYHQLSNQWQQLHQTDPNRIVAILAPRFINASDWASANKEGLFNPRTLYQPQPRTWDRWEAAADIILREAQRNASRKSVRGISTFFLRSVHSQALLGLSSAAGALRTRNEVGVILDRKKGLTDEQILNLLAFNTMPSGIRPPIEPLLKWRTTICWNDQTPEIIAKINANIDNHKTWYDPSDWPAPIAEQSFFNTQIVHKQCGIISYPKAGKIDKELVRWSQTLQTHTATWFSGDFKEDPILTIGKAQNWLVKIHPFTDGNGRISRLIMDLLAQSLELPTPILSDMDSDLYLSDFEWANEVGRGMLRHLEILESCITNSKNPQCLTLSRFQGVTP